MHLNGASDDLLGDGVSFPLPVLAALFVKIHIHLIGIWPHKLLHARTRNYYREQLARFDALFARTKQPGV